MFCSKPILIILAISSLRLAPVFAQTLKITTENNQSTAEDTYKRHILILKY